MILIFLISLVTLLTIISIYMYIVILLERKNTLIRLQEPPEWVRKHPMLMTTLKDKLAKPIGVNEVVNLLACKVVSQYCNYEPISWEQMQSDTLLFKPIIEKYDINLIVGVLSGGGFIAQYLHEVFGIDVLFVKVKKYLPGRVAKAMVKDYYGNFSLVSGRNVLIVDDSAFTGDTMQTANNFVQKFKPKNITLSSLYGFRCKSPMICVYPNMRAVVPWGLDA